MTHHSGLPSGVPKGMWTSESSKTLLDRLKDEYVTYPVNYVLSYSNVAMALLGLMIEQVCGIEFSAHMAKSILDAIGMQQSSFDLTPEIKSLLSKGYKNGKETDQLPLRDKAAGSMYSNVIDLSRFMQMVFAKGEVGNRQILQPDMIVEMLRPQNIAITLDFEKRIGLGWFLGYGKNTNEDIAAHNGATPLFRTSLIILPEKKIGVVVLTNSAEGGRILGKIAAEALKQALETKTGNFIEQKVKKIAPPDKMASEAVLQTFVGRYGTLDMLGSIERQKEALYANFGGYKFRLIPSSNGRFGVERKLLGIFPLKKIGSLELAKVRVRRAKFSGRDLLIVYYDERHWFSAEKIEPSPLPETWENMVGKYQIVDPDPESTPQDIILSNKENLLVINYKFPLWRGGKSNINLIPISETEAVTVGIGRYSGETMGVIDIEGKPGLTFWGYKMKKKTPE
jgi:hypothetical protein